MATLQDAIAELEIAYTGDGITLLEKVETVRDWLKEMADEQRDLETGLAGWRVQAEANSRQAHQARAVSRIAIGHLQAVLNKCRTHAEQQAADNAARDWLISIGSEPT